MPLPLQQPAVPYYPVANAPIQYPQLQQQPMHGGVPPATFPQNNAAMPYGMPNYTHLGPMMPQQTYGEATASYDIHVPTNGQGQPSAIASGSHGTPKKFIL